MKWRLPFLLALGLLWFERPTTVRADETSSVTVTAPTDFFVEFADETEFVAETFMSPGINSDPQLWLYDVLTGALVTTNDDFDGLQSRIFVVIPAGSYRLRAATCCNNPDGWWSSGGWNQSFGLSFTGQPVAPDATTTTVETTTTSTTENVPSTSVFVPPTTLVETTTTVVETTTTLEPTTTAVITTTTTFEPTTTTTEFLWTPTTTDATTTIAPAPIPPSQTTAAPSSSLPATSTSTIAVGSTTSSSPTETSVPDATTVAPEETVPDGDEIPVQEVNFEEQTAADIAAELAPEELELLSDDAVEQLVEGIAEADLTDEQADAIAVALSDAPDNVKEEFEDQVNVFGGQFDLYVPLGSVINVGQRRVVVAATATVLVMPVPTSTGSGNSSRKGRK